MSEEPPEKKQKREYRLGNPLSGSDKTRAYILKKKKHHKEVRVFLTPETKELMALLCKKGGCNQSEFVEKLVIDHAKKNGFLD